MALRSAVAMLAAAVFLPTVSRIGRAKEAAGPMNEITASTRPGKATGILTSRLSGRQLRVWKSIENIVLAQDEAGRPRHPKLYGLWQGAKASGYPIYIELPTPKSASAYKVGDFSVENPGPSDHGPAGVIRLYPSVIDSASTSGRFRRENGFMPFEGLRDKELRYAEVLGHELVHAMLTLTDANHARLARDLDKERTDLFIYRWKHNGEALDQETADRLNRIRSMSEDIERKAEAAEEDIWRELAAGSAAGRKALAARSDSGTILERPIPKNPMKQTGARQLAP